MFKIAFIFSTFQEKLDTELSDINKKFKDVKDAKLSLEIELAEVKADLETEKSEKIKVQNVYFVCANLT